MKQERFERFKKAMNDIGVTGMTVTQVLGCGTQKGAPEYYRGVPMDIQLLPKTQVKMVISSVPVMDVINATRKAVLPSIECFCLAIINISSLRKFRRHKCTSYK